MSKPAALQGYELRALYKRVQNATETEDVRIALLHLIEMLLERNGRVGMSATSLPWRLWQVENDEYPEPHPNDRRLVDADDICIGILFGMLVEGPAYHALIIRAVNNHDRLVAALERVRPLLNDLLHSPLWEEARTQVDAALAAAKGDPS